MVSGVPILCIREMVHGSKFVCADQIFQRIMTEM